MNEKEPPALEVRHLSVSYDRISVLWDISFAVPRGLKVAVIGPNGAGKSTFMKTILGLIKPLSGRILVAGESGRRKLRKTAYIPQRESIDRDFPITVEELVLQGRYPEMGLFKLPRKEDRLAVREALRLVDMEPYAKRQIRQLSIGQQQRIFLARAILLRADIYFMDEPFAGVDSVTEKFIFEFLDKLKEEQKTVIVIHHDLEKVREHFDWIVMLNTGLIASGPVSTCFTEENLHKTFGKNVHLLEEAFHLATEKNRGNPCSF